MKRLITIRHGQSESNKEGIIQGIATNKGLTEKGKNDIAQIAKENYEKLLKAKRIISSPYKRAMETAEIISRLINQPINTNDKIIEFNSGILSGNSHEQNEREYPEYYKIWMARKDLDGIPGAEKGEELQARVIAFLMEYYEEKEFNDIIVSHAGFLRCLINTAKGISRTTPVDSNNGAINILDDPLKNLIIEKKDRAMASNVFIVETFENKYVIKIKNRRIIPEDYEEKRILNELSKKEEELPIILSLTQKGEKTYKVLKFIDGETAFGRLDEKRKKSLVIRYMELEKELGKIQSSVYKKNQIHDMVLELNSIAKNDYVRDYGNSILDDAVNRIKLMNSRYSLAHNDLNRDNILFSENENGEAKARIIDWEGIGLYPEDYQLASFLVCAFLLEGYSVNEVLDIANKVKTNIDKEYIIYLMKIRIYKGLYFFAENKNIYTQENQEVAQSILRKYFFAAEKLNFYIDGEKRRINPAEKIVMNNMVGCYER